MIFFLTLFWFHGLLNPSIDMSEAQPTDKDLGTMVRVYYETSEIYTEGYQLEEVLGDVCIPFRLAYGIYPIADTVITGFPFASLIAYKKKKMSKLDFAKHGNLFLCFYYDGIWRILPGDLRLYDYIITSEGI